jgi:hypothetical protein
VIALSTEQGLTDWLVWATSLPGWAMADSGHDKDGIAQMCEGLAASQATGALLLRPYLRCCRKRALKPADSTKH